jgi:hypothetical protein
MSTVQQWGRKESIIWPRAALNTLRSFPFRGYIHILTDEHGNIGTHWAILDECRPKAAASTLDNVLSSPDSEGLDGYEELVKDPIASLTKCVVDPQFRGHCLSNIMAQARLNFARTEDCASTVGVTELAFRLRKLKRLGLERLGPTMMRYLPEYVFMKSPRRY